MTVGLAVAHETELPGKLPQLINAPFREFMFQMNYVIEGIGCLANEKGEEQP